MFCCAYAREDQNVSASQILVMKAISLQMFSTRIRADSFEDIGVI